jgi:hypothetical protein
MQINSDTTFAASLDECFAQVIKKRGWYKNSSFDRKKAAYHKKMFIEHRLSNEIKKIYLQSVGYEIIQPELWKKKDK